MEHARKVLLAPPMPQPILQQPMLQPVLSHLDTEIAKILHSNLSDDEKAKLYTVALRRYRLYNEEPKPDPFNQLSSQIVPENMIKTTRLLKTITVLEFQQRLRTRT